MGRNATSTTAGHGAKRWHPSALPSHHDPGVCVRLIERSPLVAWILLHRKRSRLPRQNAARAEGSREPSALAACSGDPNYGLGTVLMVFRMRETIW